MHFKEYKTILSPKNGINIYRGCTHGCIYCDSRSTVYSMDHNFTDVEVKKDAYKILDMELSRKRDKVMVGTGAMSDPYNHHERDLLYTRKCLEVIKKHGCGISILTKSNLILRDIDLISEINKTALAVVEMTLTTIDDDLCRIIEPNVSTTSERIEVLMKCKELGIPTVVWMCPFLPYINDTKENLMGLIEACTNAGVKGIIYFGMGMTLREGDREYYYKNLDIYFKGLRERYIMDFKNNYEVYDKKKQYLNKLFFDECNKRGIMCDVETIFKYMSTFPKKETQLSLFDI